MVISSEVTTTPASRLREYLTGLVSRDGGPVLVQAGHFMLQASLLSGLVLPAIAEEADRLDGADGFAKAVRSSIGVFPGESWRIGVELVRDLRCAGLPAFLTTVVNDWQHVPKNWPNGAEAARRVFYRSQSSPLPSYAAVLAECGLDGSAIVKFTHRHAGFVSENWLRRHIERRLRFLARRSRSDLRWDHGGEPCLLFQTDDGAEPILHAAAQGHAAATCASEIVELVALVREHGYRTLVNLYPLPCQGPVCEGSRLGIDLFASENLDVINVGMSCAGESTIDEIIGGGVRIHHLHSGKVDTAVFPLAQPADTIARKEDRSKDARAPEDPFFKNLCTALAIFRPPGGIAYLLREHPAVEDAYFPVAAALQNGRATELPLPYYLLVFRHKADEAQPTTLQTLRCNDNPGLLSSRARMEIGSGLLDSACCTQRVDVLTDKPVGERLLLVRSCPSNDPLSLSALPNPYHDLLVGLTRHWASVASQPVGTSTSPVDLAERLARGLADGSLAPPYHGLMYAAVTVAQRATSYASNALSLNCLQLVTRTELQSHCLRSVPSPHPEPPSDLAHLGCAGVLAERFPEGYWTEDLSLFWRRNENGSGGCIRQVPSNPVVRHIGTKVLDHVRLQRFGNQADNWLVMMRYNCPKNHGAGEQGGQEGPCPFGNKSEESGTCFAPEWVSRGFVPPAFDPGKTVATTLHLLWRRWEKTPPEYFVVALWALRLDGNRVTQFEPLGMLPGSDEAAAAVLEGASTLEVSVGRVDELHLRAIAIDPRKEDDVKKDVAKQHELHRTAALPFASLDAIWNSTVEDIIGVHNPDWFCPSFHSVWPPDNGWRQWGPGAVEKHRDAEARVRLLMAKLQTKVQMEGSCPDAVYAPCWHLRLLKACSKGGVPASLLGRCLGLDMMPDSNSPYKVGTDDDWVIVVRGAGPSGWLDALSDVRESGLQSAALTRDELRIAIALRRGEDRQVHIEGVSTALNGDGRLNGSLGRAGRFLCAALGGRPTISVLDGNVQAVWGKCWVCAQL